LKSRAPPDDSDGRRDEWAICLLFWGESGPRGSLILGGSLVEALDRYRQGGVALLLTDCDMPNMDGYELARQIQQGEEGGTDHLPIVAITANAMKDAREDCAAAGMDDYLVKPLENASAPGGPGAILAKSRQ